MVAALRNQPQIVSHGGDVQRRIAPDLRVGVGQVLFASRGDRPALSWPGALPRERPGRRRRLPTEATSRVYRGSLRTDTAMPPTSAWPGSPARARHLSARLSAGRGSISKGPRAGAERRVGGLLRCQILPDSRVDVRVIQVGMPLTFARPVQLDTRRHQGQRGLQPLLQGQSRGPNQLAFREYAHLARLPRGVWYGSLGGAASSIPRLSAPAEGCDAAAGCELGVLLVKGGWDESSGSGVGGRGRAVDLRRAGAAPDSCRVQPRLDPMRSCDTARPGGAARESTRRL